MANTGTTTSDSERQNLIKCIQNHSIYIGIITIIDSIITIIIILLINKCITSPIAHTWKTICILIIISKLILSYFIHQIMSHFQIDIKEEFII